MILLQSTWLHVGVGPVQGCLGHHPSLAGHSEHQGVIRVFQHGAQTGWSTLRRPHRPEQAQPSSREDGRWPGIEKRSRTWVCRLCRSPSCPLPLPHPRAEIEGFAIRWVLQLKPELLLGLDPHGQQLSTLISSCWDRCLFCESSQPAGSRCTPGCGPPALCIDQELYHQLEMSACL